MKASFLANMFRAAFVITVVVGSIVTLNYGLEKGTNPPLYPPLTSDLGPSPNSAPGPLEPNWGIALILLALGVFILSETIFGRETRNLGDNRSNLELASKEHWAAHARMKRRRVLGREMRKVKRVRL
jgi:ribose/xylose/arabinose/galactoside ABC-type transport system permease subunit